MGETIRTDVSRSVTEHAGGREQLVSWMGIEVTEQLREELGKCEAELDKFLAKAASEQLKEAIKTLAEVETATEVGGEAGLAVGTVAGAEGADLTGVPEAGGAVLGAGAADTVVVSKETIAEAIKVIEDAHEVLGLCKECWAPIGELAQAAARAEEKRSAWRAEIDAAKALLSRAEFWKRKP